MTEGRPNEVEKAIAEEDAILSIGAIEKATSVLDLTAGLPIRTVIEVGSGTGAILERLDQAGFGVEYVALEPATRMIEYMQQHRKISRLVTAEANTLPYSEARKARYDLAILSHVLEHLDNPASLLLDVFGIADYVVVEVPLDGNRMGNLRAWLRSRLTGVPREDNRSGHIQFFGDGDLDALVHWSGGEVLRRRAYVPKPQLRRLREAGPPSRRLYAASILAFSRIVGDARWARFYHGHYAVLARQRPSGTVGTLTRANPVYFGHRRPEG